MNSSSLLSDVLSTSEQKIPEFIEWSRSKFKQAWSKNNNEIIRKDSKYIDFTTQLDEEIENEFRLWVKRNFPEHAVYGEEMGIEKEGGAIPQWLWSIDPIDGTTNFINHNPNCSLVISLRYKGKPVYAVCDVPFQKTTYKAVNDSGFFINGHQHKSSDSATLPLDHSLLVVTYLNRPSRMIGAIGELWDSVGGIIIKMSSVMESCEVIAGQMGVGVFYLLGPHEWPAVYLFAKEGGCLIGNVGDEAEINFRKFDSKNFVIAHSKNVFNEVRSLAKIPTPLL